MVLTVFSLLRESVSALLFLMDQLCPVLVRRAGLNENVPSSRAHMLDYVIPTGWNSMGRIRRCGLVRRGLCQWSEL